VKGVHRLFSSAELLFRAAHFQISNSGISFDKTFKKMKLGGSNCFYLINFIERLGSCTYRWFIRILPKHDVLPGDDAFISRSHTNLNYSTSSPFILRSKYGKVFSAEHFITFGQSCIICKMSFSWWRPPQRSIRWQNVVCLSFVGRQPQLRFKVCSTPYNLHPFLYGENV